MRLSRVVLLLFLAAQLWDGVFHAVLAGLTLFYAIGAIGPWLAHYSLL